jgi:hypothetical protein
MESLLLSCRALSSPTMCRFIPALSVPSMSSLQCHVLPPQLRDLRRLLRYRNMVVQQSVRMQNKIAGLLMESGTTFNKQKLHQKKYFADLMKSLEEVPGEGDSLNRAIKFAQFRAVLLFPPFLPSNQRLIQAGRIMRPIVLDSTAHQYAWQ